MFSDLNDPLTYANFKVTSIFNAEFLSNGRRWRHVYNGRRIGTRMLGIERCHFQRSPVTLNLDFKARHYSTFTISNVANTVLYVPSMLTGCNVRLSNLLISFCFTSVII